MLGYVHSRQPTMILQVSVPIRRETLLPLYFLRTYGFSLIGPTTFFWFFITYGDGLLRGALTWLFQNWNHGVEELVNSGLSQLCHACIQFSSPLCVKRTRARVKRTLSSLPKDDTCFRHDLVVPIWRTAKVYFARLWVCIAVGPWSSQPNSEHNVPQTRIENSDASLASQYLRIFSISFHCLLLPAEARQLPWEQRENFYGSRSIHYKQSFGIIYIRVPKTRGMAGHAAQQHVFCTVLETRAGAPDHLLQYRAVPQLRRKDWWTSERTLERYVHEATFLFRKSWLSKEIADLLRALAELPPRFFAEPNCRTQRQPTQPPRCNGKCRGVHSARRSGVEQRSFAHAVSTFGASPYTDQWRGSKNGSLQTSHTMRAQPQWDGFCRGTQTAVAPWSCFKFRIWFFFFICLFSSSSIWFE